MLDNNDLLAPKAPYLKADFAEGEILSSAVSRPRASGAPAPRVLSSTIILSKITIYWAVAGSTA